MVSDPRCPECAGKVSSTATWCMHCGVDFPSAIDADSGRPVQDRADQQADYDESVDDGSSDATTVGFLVAVFGLVTLPFVAPPNTLVLAAVAALAAGLFAARQPSLGEAFSRGGSALAVAPLALWSLALVLPGTGQLSLGSLLGPLAYAIVVSSVARAVG
ncbi:hypothetical protein NDI56_11130 [Haloarcula sp. S1CR25-12]|uniref:Zinc ribbon domain-containing protein n=1 Tax=Haloarcula saliterrae TaxID=2950534 RepID=A0ABU2FCG0_9EURY|nr:hypothetical protein [Haloarcula sp. S1CR25-12]MDS0259947.1 hypothetical protein [Haloarcula sp. S1CR25-12]